MRNRTQKKFDLLLNRYFTQRLKADPLWANSLGMRQGEGKLGQTGLRAVSRDEIRRQQALLDLEKLAIHQLEPEQHLDRLAWRSMLLSE